VKGMAPGHTAAALATARRVLAQLRHDPRTLALLFGAPILLNGLLAWILSGSPGAFDHWGAVLVGLFPLMIMFMITSVATLRERTSGTLERLMAMPVAKSDFIAGYAIAFGALAAAQAIVVSAVTFGLFGLEVMGPVAMVLLVAVLDALLGMALGLFVSAFANTEFQAVQFFPALLLPQLLLCGLIAPTSSLPTFLHAVSVVLPLTYAVNAMKDLTTQSGISSTIWRDIAVLVGFLVGLLAAGAATLRRRTP
jgi:ABC-2 type transport system permease protein